METIPATIDPVWADRVYTFYGVTPYWSEGKTSHPDIFSYRMSGRTEDLAMRYPDGSLIAFYDVAPYWTSCGCGAEAMNFAGALEPARTEWRPGRGAVEKMDPATGKIMCLVEIPAKYKTVQKQVLVKPATTREVEIPAQYEMQKVQKMTEPAQERVIQIPAEYKTVEKTQKVADGYFEWRKAEGCEPK